MLDVAIIGGGLAGLSLARHLNTLGIDFCVFEARPRFGGRILSQSINDESSEFRIDLGPSWIWPDDQPLMAEFIQQNKLECYQQWNHGQSLFQPEAEQTPQRFNDPATYADARRLKGGSQVLIDNLLQALPDAQLLLNHSLQQLCDQGDHIELQFKQTDAYTHQLKARRVALMLPPRLLAQNVVFQPQLNPRLVKLMNETPTWMASHAKAVLLYNEPFWRQQGLSGSAYANYPSAMLAEVFDISSHDGKYAGLSGFFALPAPLRQKYRNDLPTLLLAQMIQLFGPQAAAPVDIQIQDWCSEDYTATRQDQQPPDNHPSYGHQFFQLDHWNDKLFFGGTETASAFGGYLEGALQSASYIAQQLSISAGVKPCQIA